MMKSSTIRIPTQRAPDLGYAPRFFELFSGFGFFPFQG